MCEGMGISSDRSPLGLRRTKIISPPKSDNGCGDVESQGVIPSPSSVRRQQQRRRRRDGTKKSSLPVLTDETTRTATTATDGSSSSSWKELAHKIAIAILTDLDDETLQREDTEMILVIITLIKEAMLGILIAFVAVSLVLFLDHRLLLNIPTARNFRRATFQLMNDRETLRNLEENADIKLMEMDDYTTMMQDIENAANKTRLAHGIFDTRSQDMIQMAKEGKEYGQLLQPMLEELGFDKFCPDCIWSRHGPPQNRGRRGGNRLNKKITCQERLDALQTQRQGTSKYQAMISVMKKYSCRTHDTNDLEDSDQGSFQQVFKENALLKDWDVSKRNFKANGIYNTKYGGSMTCFQRVMYLNERYQIDLDRAGAMVMVEEPHCTLSYYDGLLKQNNDDSNTNAVHEEKKKVKGNHRRSTRGDTQKMMAVREPKEIHSNNNEANNEVRINNHHSNEKKLDREMKSKLMPYVDKRNSHDKRKRPLLKNIARERGGNK